MTRNVDLIKPTYIAVFILYRSKRSGDPDPSYPGRVRFYPKAYLTSAQSDRLLPIAAQSISQLKVVSLRPICDLSTVQLVSWSSP